MRTLLLGIGAAAIACAVGCSKSTPAGNPLVLKGNVPASTLALDNARVVAVGSDGRVLWSYLDATHQFRIALPGGVSYRILIANALATGQQRVVGHLVNQAPGGPTRWIGTGIVGTFDLGSLRLAPATTSGLTALDHGGSLSESEDGGEAVQNGDSGTSGDKDGEHDGGLDCDTHEDSSGGASLCGTAGTAGSSTEADDDHDLEASNNPGAVLGTDEGDKDKDKDKDTTGMPPCPGGDAGGTGSSSGSPGASSSGSTTGSGSGGTSTGSCNVSADCASPLVCIAGTCTNVI
jgi:hypothetical protein